MQSPIQTYKPNPDSLFADFLLIGIQSFGGGSSTFSLIHQAAIKRGWMSEEEFVRAWALVQISPGINLIKLTVMIGYNLQGWQGLLAAVSGMLLPSAAVTVLMTAGYASIREIIWVQAIMKGIIPAVIGLSFAMGVQMSQPIISTAQKEGPVRLGIHFFILAGAALLMGAAWLSPILIILLSGITAVVLFAIVPARIPDIKFEKLP